MAGTIVWLRTDLRIDDHSALRAAFERGLPIVPVFIWAPDEERPWPPGSASRWWLHHSLGSLQEALAKLDLRLILRRGPSLEALKTLVQETDADTVLWSRRYEPAVIARDKKVRAALEKEGLHVETYNASLLHEPTAIRRKAAGKDDSGAYRVFTPYWRACRNLGEPDEALAAPARREGVATPGTVHSDRLTDLDLLPKVPWDAGLRQTWTPGIGGAQTELNRFVSARLKDYDTERDRPDHVGTSRLSPYLRFGEISPRQVWRAIVEHFPGHRPQDQEEVGDVYLRQLVWREFAYHLMYHFPQTPEQPLRPEFAEFPWADPPHGQTAWQRGQTGFPIVDAGMRELWATGWMHNRVRMIVASFLIKDLLIPWQTGAAWFWDTLVDADLANNTLGWQWVAGCGADAAPFFRIFNPVTQGKKFDPEGNYVRKWVPELATLPTQYVHEPRLAPPTTLAERGIQLGEHYPLPIVDHAQARQRALEALSQIRSTGSSG